jgi:FixJ family two-component response regulator
LVIDDQRAVTTAVQQVAEPLGFEVRTLNSSQQATEEFITFRPDVVLLDMVIPEKDGIDLLHEFLLTGIPTRFIVMSGFGRALIRLAEGVTAYHQTEVAAVLKKPFRREELADLLTRVMDDAPAPVPQRLDGAVSVPAGGNGGIPA